MLPAALAVVAIGAVVLALSVASRLRVGRLPRSLVVQYAPMRGADVIGDAVLAGRDQRGPAAGLLDLAVRRQVRLIAEPAKGGGRATVGVELDDRIALSPRDIALLEALFGPGHPGHRVRRFSKDGRTVSRRLRRLVQQTAAELARNGLVAGEHQGGRSVLRLLGQAGVAAALVLSAVSLLSGEWSAAAVAGLALVIAVAVVVVTPRGPGRRFTPSGQARREHLDGLRQYMAVAEADRIRALQSPRSADLLALSEETRAELGTPAGRFRLHERLLPYAVIFGIEREWMSHLRVAYSELDRASLAHLADVTDSTLDLFALADILGDLTQLGFAVGDLTDASGAVLDVVGGVVDAVGNLTP